MNPLGDTLHLLLSLNSISCTHVVRTLVDRQSIGVSVELEWNPMPCPEIDFDKWVDHFHSIHDVGDVVRWLTSRERERISD